MSLLGVAISRHKPLVLDIVCLRFGIKTTDVGHRDNLGVKKMNNNKEISFKSLFTGNTISLRKDKEISQTFQTDGCEAFIKYLDLVTITKRGSVKPARKIIAFHTQIRMKMN